MMIIIVINMTIIIILLSNNHLQFRTNPGCLVSYLRHNIKFNRFVSRNSKRKSMLYVVIVKLTFTSFW